MRVTAFIPSRAGSKGVPRKNVRPLDGKPVIAYSIEAALKSPEISQVVVTTNCEETKAIAKDYPVIIIDRPSELAEDSTPTYPVIEHAIQVLELQQQNTPDLVLLLQCTSPLRTATHISEALTLFSNPNVNAVVSVIEVGDEHPARMYHLSQEGRLEPLDADKERIRRQDLPKLFRRNGAIYAMRYQEFNRQGTMIAKNATAYVMPLDVSVNIDTELDFVIADVLLSRMRRT